MDDSLAHKTGIWFPTLQDVHNIHDGIIKWLGGDAGIVNLGSAAAALDFAERGPPTSAQIDLFDRAAFLLRGIAQDHPFTDGNKRTGLVATWAFLLVSGFEVVSSTDEAERFMLEVAQGHQDLAQMADWLRSHARKFKIGGSPHVVLNMQEKVPASLVRKIKRPGRPAVVKTMEDNREVLVRLAKK